MRACVCACVRACVLTCVRVFVRASFLARERVCVHTCKYVRACERLNVRAHGRVSVRLGNDAF